MICYVPEYYYENNVQENPLDVLLEAADDEWGSYSNDCFETLEIAMAERPRCKKFYKLEVNYIEEVSV